MHRYETILLWKGPDWLEYNRIRYSNLAIRVLWKCLGGFYLSRSKPCHLLQKFLFVDCLKGTQLKFHMFIRKVVQKMYNLFNGQIQKMKRKVSINGGLLLSVTCPTLRQTDVIISIEHHKEIDRKKWVWISINCLMNNNLL